ncbi:2,3,4,5-tetrahydropyridine-2,6-dicarboxylate N-succinyltransferase [Sinobacterium norvegicum]|uniref:2,3,4,5-tetrahydropyridine-2,6-dicarboxylate N-succinyltransferase n=1 Tax=Sinobacterium norvegicum TaxID=1641715 RepID=A0ABM9ADD4_9GAMM|nr:2,3,4,5-tetrahydropyridine-2,6-dicarboxylate N-succinyltransferase [Sinobacterium norvegicum]CAH0990719.1 2,3,4,5-tetrahydropyridine-2,6-dicarboxylate N-succinyltransferase [Sinobacterium norvegicum]
MTNSVFSLGLGVGTQNNKGEWLEVFYAQPLLQPSEQLVGLIAEAVGYEGGNQAITVAKAQLQKLAGLLFDAEEKSQAKIAATLAEGNQPAVITILASDAAPETVAECYLKLHLLSHTLVKPHGVNLTGMFGVLPNVAWTNKGAIDLAELDDAQLKARCNGEIIDVLSVDKFPKMLNYVVPAGTRVGDASRVRLGAYLGEGTTIMHEGFVNFNAGTEGPGMIEGRISAGVFVGKGSDLGGGCSTMGTLSGGNSVVISVGEECLIGANAGIGLPLGDRCTVEAGLYITAGSKLNLLDEDRNVVEVVKARDLAGKSDLLFRRNSISGALEVLSNKSAIALNAELHSNN